MPSPSTTISPRALSATASATSSGGANELAPGDAPPASPVPSSSEPHPLSTTIPTTRTDPAIDAVRMATPSIAASVQYGRGHLETRIAPPDGSPGGLPV